MELLDALSIEKIDLVGVSMGGGIALSFALDHPLRVRSLILISPQIAGWEWSVPWQMRWQSIVEAARSGRMAHAKRLWWDHPMFASTRDSEAVADLRDEIERFEGRQWIADGHALVMSLGRKQETESRFALRKEWPRASGWRRFRPRRAASAAGDAARTRA